MSLKHSLFLNFFNFIANVLMFRFILSLWFLLEPNEKRRSYLFLILLFIFLPLSFSISFFFFPFHFHGTKHSLRGLNVLKIIIKKKNTRNSKLLDHLSFMFSLFVLHQILYIYIYIPNFIHIYIYATASAKDKLSPSKLDH